MLEYNWIRLNSNNYVELHFFKMLHHPKGKIISFLLYIGILLFISWRHPLSLLFNEQKKTKEPQRQMTNYARNME